MKFIRYIILTFVMTSLPCGSMQAQNEIISFGPFEFLKLDNMPQTEFYFFNNLIEHEKPINVLSFGDNLYCLNVISNAWKSLDCAIKFRLEDELPYENRVYDYSGFFYFDFNLHYKIKAFNFSINIENLLGFKDSSFNIEPLLEQQLGVYEDVLYTHKSNFLISTSIAFNF